MLFVWSKSRGCPVLERRHRIAGSDPPRIGFSGFPEELGLLAFTHLFDVVELGGHFHFVFAGILGFLAVGGRKIAKSLQNLHELPFPQTCRRS